MAKGTHVEVFICREDGKALPIELHEKIVRKVTALLKRLGCSAHGSWRMGESPEVEDLLG